VVHVAVGHPRRLQTPNELAKRKVNSGIESSCAIKARFALRTLFTVDIILKNLIGNQYIGLSVEGRFDGFIPRCSRDHFVTFVHEVSTQRFTKRVFILDDQYSRPIPSLRAQI
jgi:hypothetical protein